MEKKKESIYYMREFIGTVRSWPLNLQLLECNATFWALDRLSFHFDTDGEVAD